MSLKIIAYRGQSETNTFEDLSEGSQCWSADPYYAAQYGELVKAELSFKNPLDFGKLNPETATRENVRSMLAGLDWTAPLPKWCQRNDRLRTLGDWFESCEDWGPDFAANILTDALAEAIHKQLGHDGIVFPEHGFEGSMTYIVFSGDNILNFTKI